MDLLLSLAGDFRFASPAWVLSLSVWLELSSLSASLELLSSAVSAAASTAP
ncbi:hypothetical protein ACWD62_28425 [Streptomyces sp. NPDC005146]